MSEDLVDLITDFMPGLNFQVVPLAASFGRRFGKLTRNQVVALMLLRERDGRTVSEIGDQLNVAASSVTGILDGLERGRLILRVCDGSDRRKTCIVLTSTGRKVADSLELEMSNSLAARIASLSDEERTELTLHLAATATILRKLFLRNTRS